MSQLAIADYLPIDIIRFILSFLEEIDPELSKGKIKYSDDFFHGRHGYPYYNIKNIKDYCIGCAAGGFIDLMELAFTECKNSSTSISWRDCLIQASRFGQQKTVEHINLTNGENNWQVCLSSAASSGRLNIVKQAITHGAINIEDSLNTALNSNHTDVVIYLLQEYGMLKIRDINRATKDKNNEAYYMHVTELNKKYQDAFKCAVLNGCVELYLQLIDSEFVQPIYFDCARAAVRNGYVELLTAVLSMSRHRHVWTAAKAAKLKQLAIDNKQPDVLDYLEEKFQGGANVERVAVFTESDQWQTKLHRISEYGYAYKIGHNLYEVEFYTELSRAHYLRADHN